MYLFLCVWRYPEIYVKRFIYLCVSICVLGGGEKMGEGIGDTWNLFIYHLSIVYLLSIIYLSPTIYLLTYTCSDWAFFLKYFRPEVSDFELSSDFGIFPFTQFLHLNTTFIWFHVRYLMHMTERKFQTFLEHLQFHCDPSLKLGDLSLTDLRFSAIFTNFPDLSCLG